MALIRITEEINTNKPTSRNFQLDYTITTSCSDSDAKFITENKTYRNSMELIELMKTRNYKLYNISSCNNHILYHLLKKE